jgi:Cu2+-exporting ATPase
VEGRKVKVVSPGYVEEQGVSVHDSRVMAFAGQGKTVVYVLVDGELKGVIALADVIRPESRDAIQGLKEMGIQVMMLTRGFESGRAVGGAGAPAG